MIFNQHYNLVGQHAFLSASQGHWRRYDNEKLDQRFLNSLEAKRGTELHEFAANAIRLKVKLQGNKTTLAMYVNDAIGFRMVPEQILYYSDNCFGTADAICFRRNKLRIFDLKNGITKVSEDQLVIYAALFCLEYRYKPHEIEYDLRFYKENQIIHQEVTADEILETMTTIVEFDKRIDALKAMTL